MTPSPRTALIKNGYFLFWGQWPSNWHPSPFTIDGQEYSCVEQFMMAEKARLFGDKEAELQILSTNDPAVQKAIGRQIKGYDDAKWAAERYQRVLHGVVEKYRQNPELLKLLMATGNLEFVEASPKDFIWGIGLKKDHPDATNPAKWRGTNLLGKATTEARSILRAEGLG